MANEFSMDLSEQLLAPNLDVNMGMQPEDTGGQSLLGGDTFSFMDNIGKYGTLASGLAGMFNAYQQNKLQKKAFKFQKGVTNRNIANQAVTVNNQLANQAKMQSQMFGNKVGTQDYQNYINANQKQVDGSAI